MEKQNNMTENMGACCSHAGYLCNASALEHHDLLTPAIKLFWNPETGQMKSFPKVSGNKDSLIHSHERDWEMDGFLPKNHNLNKMYSWCKSKCKEGKVPQSVKLCFTILTL